MDPLLESFITESRENLESASQCFLDLEDQPGNADVLNDLFRSMHTIKGSSGLFEMIVPLTKVVHAAEDLLDAARSSDIILTSDHIDLFLDCMDQVGAWLDAMEECGVLPDDAGPIGRDIADKLRAQLSAGETIGVDQNEILAGEQPKSSDALPGWISAFPDPGSVKVSPDREMGPDFTWVAVEYRPDSQCFFSGDDPLLTVRSLSGLHWIEAAPAEPWLDKDEIDPYQCNLIIRALYWTTEDKVSAHLRYVEDQVKTYSLNAAISAQQSKQPVIIPGDQADAAINLLETQVKLLLADHTDDLVEGCTISALSVAQSVCSQMDWTFDSQKYASLQDDASPLERSLALIDDLKELLSFIGLDEVEELVNSETVAETGPEVDSTPEVVSQKPVPTPVSKVAKVRSASRASASPPASSANKVLRVDQSKIDSLMDMVGELAVAKNALPFLAQRAEVDFGVKELSREIQSQYAVINRLSEEIQGAVMQIRMVPVSSVFQRFPRLVRDLSRKMGKNIRLVLEGEDTEADKNVIEELADPLIHLVRNSLDHGMETPEERIDAGKPEEGVITLSATQKDDHVVIEVIDDGRGIDPDVLKSKALDKGVIDAEQAENMGHQDALNLIFAAGFSTVEQVSDLSGRGVGMDVVRSAVNQANGSVSVTSELGRGTTLRLTLPLSMSVTQVMMIEVDGQTYGVSSQIIRESVKVPTDSIQRIKQAEAVVLRNKLVPLFRLRNLMALNPPESPPEEESILVIAVDGSDVGIVIDDFHEGIDIIQKPLVGLMEAYPYYSGSALLGDGRVLMVLDMKELIQCP